MMKLLCSLSSAMAILALIGCVVPESSTISASSARSVDGTVVSYEDGGLELRLDNGKTLLLRTPKYDAEITKSKGRRCRVQWKRTWSDDIAAYGWFDEITSLEWLEPHSSRFGSVWDS
jgi:hypothetical protein